MKFINSIQVSFDKAGIIAMVTNHISIANVHDANKLKTYVE